MKNANGRKKEKTVNLAKKMNAGTAVAAAFLALLSPTAKAGTVSASRATAKATIIRELKKGKGGVTLIRVSMTEQEAERIVSEIEREKFGLWRSEPASYVREWISDGTWFEGFAVRPNADGKIMEINRLLNAKAKKVVSKNIRRKASQKKKAKAIAKGTASLLKYKAYDPRRTEASTLKNLKKNKGYCLIYALVCKAACERAGLKCLIAYGKADGGDHAWNKVLVNGKWRYVDACWYDCTHKSRYLLSNRLWPSHKLKRLANCWG